MGLAWYRLPAACVALAAAAAALLASLSSACAQPLPNRYVDTAYQTDSAYPLPNEPPLTYFQRQWDRSSEIPATEASFAEPSELSESYTQDYGRLTNPCEDCGPSDRKPGVFQKWSSRATYIGPSDGDDTLGILDLETWVVFGFPFPTRDNPMLITPGFAARLLDASPALDLPDTIYDAYVQARWLGKFNQCWGYDLVVTPGIYSDFEEVDSDAWRITGHAVASYQRSPQKQWLFGAAYLDREDVSVIPVGGLIYTPCDGVRWEMIVPRPRYARRFYADCCQEDWWYVAGEFGGGSWSIQRTSGADDIITLSDYRLLLGWERKLDGGAGMKLEVGYVFGREIQYTSAMPDVDLDSAFLVRGGVTF